MSFERPISFKDALDDCELWGADPSLFLGNGFSMAWDPERFAYDALLDGATDELSEEINEIFSHYDTSNFELIMHALEDARAIAKIYKADPTFRTELRNEIDKLRDALVNAVHQHHSSDASAVTSAQSTSCAKFLEPFEELFTTSYDLLLYWVINRSGTLRAKFKDGFGNSGRGTPLLWTKPRREQTTHYLHGALHFVERSSGDIEKLQWTGAQPIMDLVRDLLEVGDIPLIISEGLSEKKKRRILSNPYLRRCWQALISNDRPLFVLGFSFGDQDAHIIEAVVRSRTPELYVGLHAGGRGRIKDALDLAVAERAKSRTLPTLRITYFDANTINPWS